MSAFLGIAIAAVSVFTVAIVAWLFVWAAKKDGEEDQAIQKRLGIRRGTRLGRRSQTPRHRAQENPQARGKSVLGPRRVVC